MHMTIAAYQVQASFQLQQALSASMIKRKQAEPCLPSKYMVKSPSFRCTVDADIV